METAIPSHRRHHRRRSLIAAAPLMRMRWASVKGPHPPRPSPLGPKEQRRLQHTRCFSGEEGDHSPPLRVPAERSTPTLHRRFPLRPRPLSSASSRLPHRFRRRTIISSSGPARPLLVVMEMSAAPLHSATPFPVSGRDASVAGRHLPPLHLSPHRSRPPPLRPLHRRLLRGALLRTHFLTHRPQRCERCAKSPWSLRLKPFWTVSLLPLPLPPLRPKRKMRSKISNTTKRGKMLL